MLIIVLAVWAKAVYQQREQARLQDQVRNLLFEYIPVEGGSAGEFEMESRPNSRGNSSLTAGSKTVS